MSEDSTQLSVAELLARNGQGAPASGGGRRRRSGRGIAVNDLTGDLPQVRAGGGSAHAAPDHDEPAAHDPDGGFGYAAPSDYAAEPDHSPLSGPIAFYNPLAPSSQSISDAPSFDYQPPDYGAQNYGQPYPAEAPEPERNGWAPPGGPDLGRGDPFASPNGVQPTTGGRRARRELAESLAGRDDSDDSFAPPESAAPAPGGRRRRPEAEDESTEVRPFGGAFPADPSALATTAWSPNGPAPDPMAPPRRDRAPEPPARGEPAMPPRRNGADGPPPQGLPAWSARRRPGPDFPPQQDFPPPDRNGAPPDRNGAEPGVTVAWSLASRDQQLLSGPTLAGDMLRDEAERDGRRGPGRPSNRADRRDNRPVADLLAVDVHGATEIYPTVRPDEDDDLDYDEDDLLEFDDEDDEDDYEDERPSRRARSRPARSSALGARSKALLSGGDRPQWLSFGGGSDATGKRQWLVLGGQVVGAAVAGMLLFKGFEKMWDVLPFVALALAVVVILGLVALVRVLRRTDDLYSTVIAVVVGIFVTLGPLAFLLSTN
ncbi:hypothetical protein KO481_04565 [Nocardia sp. NEAU-G5]|uniref:Transmembrane protein n=1 Tax=Nocardia albiluteola TaxID=2842303 RepID=A0ABS6ARZ2_9NOCA|nr:hypothetical protein [Nocardia albiluteola]MBU3060797.1 hypothetical protein [Nocardia albiluteola]